MSEQDTSYKSVYADWEADKASEDEGKIASSEKRQARAEHGIKAMEAVHVGEVFSTEEGVRDFIKNTDAQTFMRLLVWLNGNLRGIPPKGRDTEPQDMIVGEDVPPRVEDKPELIEELWAAVQRMNESGRPLEDIATLTSLGTNTIHYFGNANGRISRAAYFLLRDAHPNFEAEKPILQTLLTERQGSQLFDLHSYFYGRYINDLIYNEEMGVDRHDPLSPSGFDNLYTIRSIAIALHEKKPNLEKEELELAAHLICTREGHWGCHGFLAFAKFIKDRGELEKYAQINLDHAGNPGTSSLKAADILASLSKEDIRQIWDIYWNIKKKFVEKIIDTVDQPDKYIYDESADKPEQLYDILRTEVDHSSDRLKVMLKKVYEDKELINS